MSMLFINIIKKVHIRFKTINVKIYIACQMIKTESVQRSFLTRGSSLLATRESLYKAKSLTSYVVCDCFTNKFLQPYNQTINKSHQLQFSY